MPATTAVVALDGAISTTDAAWPLLAYDDQVTNGTLILWDTSIDAQWPTGVVGGAVNPGDAWKNLGENYADGVQQAGVAPVYDATGAQFAAGTTGSIYWPAGLADLAALGWPDFHLSCWGVMPANPATSGTHRLFGYGNLNTAAANTIQAFYNYNGSVLGVTAQLGGLGAAAVDQKANIGKAFCLAMTMKKTSDPASDNRIISVYFNNALITQVTGKPTPAAQPTASFGLGKATSGFAGPDDAKLRRMILENCTLSGFDPEVRRAAEWKAKHTALGL